MDRLAYTALSAVQGQTAIRAQIANTMANISTVGFKQSFQSAAQAVKFEGAGFDSRYQPSLRAQDLINLKPGTPIYTDQPMDIALNDKTVLGVQAKDGSIGFTRRGDLRVGAQGILENGAGHLIMGEAGPITAPQGQVISIASDGTLYASSPAEPKQQAVEVGRLMLRDASLTQLIRRKDGLFEPLKQAGIGGDFASGPKPVSLKSGMLEGSNANAVETMVKMIDFSRSFEMQLKIIKESRTLDKAGSSMMKLP